MICPHDNRCERLSADYTSTLNRLEEPLTIKRTSDGFNYDLADLDSQLNERVALLFLRYCISLKRLPNGKLNWENAISNLLLEISKPYAPWIFKTSFSAILNERKSFAKNKWGSEADPVFASRWNLLKPIDLPVEVAWELIVALAREHIDGFKLRQEFTKPGTKNEYRTHEYEILALVDQIRAVSEKNGNRISLDRLTEDSEVVYDSLPAEAKPIYRELHSSYPGINKRAISRLRKTAKENDTLVTSAERQGRFEHRIVYSLQKLLTDEKRIRSVEVHYLQFSKLETGTNCNC